MEEKILKVKFTKKDGDFLKGKEYDLREAEARKFVESHKIAEYVYPSKSVERRVTTQRKASNRKPIKLMPWEEIRPEENEESEE